ncbi:hypothetical protein ACFLSI_03980 [Bacteroidota bacterium]
MKTTMKKNKKGLKSIIKSMIIVIVLFGSTSLYSQEGSSQSENKSAKTKTMKLKFQSIQGKTGAHLAVNHEVLATKDLIMSIEGGINLTHKSVNTGFIGLMGQYNIYKNDKINFGPTLFVGIGSAKDYPVPKSNLFDNILNIFGPEFYFFEPGLSLEVKITENQAIVLGGSYRFANGIDENSYQLEKSKLRNNDLCGLSMSIGLKF